LRVPEEKSKKKVGMNKKASDNHLTKFDVYCLGFIPNPNRNPFSLLFFSLLSCLTEKEDH